MLKALRWMFIILRSLLVLAITIVPTGLFILYIWAVLIFRGDDWHLFQPWQLFLEGFKPGWAREVAWANGD